MPSNGPYFTFASINFTEVWWGGGVLEQACSYDGRRVDKMAAVTVNLLTASRFFFSPWRMRQCSQIHTNSETMSAVGAMASRCSEADSAARASDLEVDVWWHEADDTITRSSVQLEETSWNGYFTLWFDRLHEWSIMLLYRSWSW